MFKNRADQKLRVFAFNLLTNEPVLGDEANITCKVSINNAGPIDIQDTNPVETEDGYYLFDLTQSETNGDFLDFYPDSATPNIQVITVGHDRQTVAYPTVSTSTSYIPISLSPYVLIPADGTAFTSIEEIRRIFSIEGVDLHLDDLDDQEETYITELCSQATSRILTYLGGRYDFNDLSSHPRIREIATYIACWKISHRRGNPSLYIAQYEEALLELERFRDGTLFLDLPTTYGARAVMQTPVIDNRFVYTGNRINPRSSSDVKSGQSQLYLFPFEWM